MRCIAPCDLYSWKGVYTRGHFLFLRPQLLKLFFFVVVINEVFIEEYPSFEPLIVVFKGTNDRGFFLRVLMTVVSIIVTRKKMKKERKKKTHLFVVEPDV